MRKGIVKWFSNEKGYGFIVDSETKEEFFVHFTAIIAEGFKSLAEGQGVTFETARGAHGVQATKVTVE